MRQREWARIDALTHDQLEQWLKSKPAEAIAGMPQDGAACPIHNFIEERLGFDLNCGNCDITEHWAPSYHPTKSYPTPFWMALFIDAVDAEAFGERHIRAGRALQLLHDLRAERPYDFRRVDSGKAASP